MLRVYIWLSLIFGEMKGLSVGRLSRNINSDQSHEYTPKHAQENFPQFEPKLNLSGDLTFSPGSIYSSWIPEFDSNVLG